MTSKIDTGFFLKKGKKNDIFDIGKPIRKTKKEPNFYYCFPLFVMENEKQNIKSFTMMYYYHKIS
jgi:hypothetical protein